MYLCMLNGYLYLPLCTVFCKDSVCYIIIYMYIYIPHITQPTHTMKPVLTRDRQVYFAFINLFLCLCTKTTHSLQSFLMRANFSLFFKFVFLFLKCWKMFCCEHQQNMLSPYIVRFALSLTVAEICANLCVFL